MAILPNIKKETKMLNKNETEIFLVTDVDLSTKENRLLIMASSARKGLDKASKMRAKAQGLSTDTMSSYSDYAVEKLKYRPAYFVCPISNPDVNTNPKVYNDTYTALAVNHCTTHKGTLNEKLWNDYLYSKANAGNTLPKDCKGKSKIAKANKSIHKARKARAKVVTDDIGRDMGNIRRGICSKLKLEVIAKVNDFKEVKLPEKSNKLSEAVANTTAKTSEEKIHSYANSGIEVAQNATNLKNKIKILALYQQIVNLVK
tara:strand:- start:99 stop:875 length:777 start_codon:yes stop_codon:yes gene_type:complete